MAEPLPDQIQKLGNINAKLERSLAKLGTLADTQDFRAGLEKDLKAGNTLSRSLVDDCKAYKGDDRKKVVKDFQREFKRYQAVNHQVQAKSEATVRVMEKKEGKMSSSVAMSPSAMSSPAGDMSSPDAGDGKLSEQQMAEEEAKIEFVEYDVEQIENRHARILQIERDVLEVASMVKDLNMLVEEQGVQLDIAADNIASARNHTDGALIELMKAEEHSKAIRKRQCILLVLVLIILGVIAGVIGGIYSR